MDAFVHVDPHALPAGPVDVYAVLAAAAPTGAAFLGAPLPAPEEVLVGVVVDAGLY